MRGRAATARCAAPSDASSFSIQELPVASFVFQYGTERVLSMNPSARTLFGLTGLDLDGIKAADLVGYDVDLDVATPGPRQLTMPLRGNFDVIVATAHATSTSDRPPTMVMLVPSSRGGAGQKETSRVVGWDRVADQCKAYEGAVLCVAIGVVGLPAVNSDFCRSVGDYAITAFQQRLLLAGGDDCVVERVDGTCFLVLLPSGGGDRLAVQRLLNVARRPITGPHGDVVLGSAAGVSVGSPRTPLVLFDRAVRNLEHALLRGAGSSEWTDSPCRLQTTPARLAAPLLSAVQRGEIVADFQPVVSLDGGEIVEFEAFARWPGREYVSPRGMLDLAYDIGIQTELRTCVVRAAVELLRRQSGLGGSRRVSINVGSKELTSPAFAETVFFVFDAAGMPASRLQIEITDTIADADLAAAASTIQVLRRRGVSVALDGLRGGAVGLLALMKLEIDVIKVEAALLVSESRVGSAGAALRSVLDLAAEFGVDVIAKNVETVAQHERLVSAGYLLGQGRLYATPDHAEAITPDLAERVRQAWEKLAVRDEPSPLPQPEHCSVA